MDGRHAGKWWLQAHNDTFCEQPELADSPPRCARTPCPSHSAPFQRPPQQAAQRCPPRTLLSVRTAAKRSTGLLEDRKSCSTVTAGVSSRVDTSRMLQMARAASKITISAAQRSAARRAQQGQHLLRGGGKGADSAVQRPRPGGVGHACCAVNWPFPALPAVPAAVKPYSGRSIGIIACCVGAAAAEAALSPARPDTHLTCAAGSPPGSRRRAAARRPPRAASPPSPAAGGVGRPGVGCMRWHRSWA